MYICLCHAVTDRQIHQAVAEGATSMRELRQRLGLCSSCGKCGPCAHQLLKEKLAEAKALLKDDLAYAC